MKEDSSKFKKKEKYKFLKTLIIHFSQQHNIIITEKKLFFGIININLVRLLLKSSEELILLILTKMKKLLFTSIIGLLIAAGTSIKAQNQPDEYLGLPGDNLNLYAVMNLFQESETIEDFERKLNDPDQRINNLDLNGDNLVDYIMVNDYIDGDDHNIVMSVALNSHERQDVGVFTVEKFRNGSVQIQLIGDNDLYGNNYIIEPIYDDTPNPGYRGRNGNNNSYVTTTTFQIAAWPMIQFIYQPRYVRWHSNWHWGYYPTYWSPWRPYYYHYYYGYHHNYFPVYQSHYRHWHQPRYTRYNDYYYHSVRSHSPYVSSRIKEGHYKSTYSRPESRRDGEALYARNHANRGSESINRNGITSRSSRPASVNNQGKRTTTDRNVIRQPNSASTRTRTNEQSNARSSRSVNNRSNGTAAPSQNRTTVTRSSDQKERTATRSNSSPNNRSTMDKPSQQRATRSENMNRTNRNETVSQKSTSPQRTVAPNPSRSNTRVESAKAPRQSRSESGSQTRTSKSSSSKTSRSSDNSNKSDSKSERR